MSRGRVPPPPPPGFGDEDYYRLYGRPEDYHRYRKHLEYEVASGGGRPPPNRRTPPDEYRPPHHPRYSEDHYDDRRGGYYSPPHGGRRPAYPHPHYPGDDYPPPPHHSEDLYYRGRDGPDERVRGRGIPRYRQEGDEDVYRGEHDDRGRGRSRLTSAASGSPIDVDASDDDQDDDPGPPVKGRPGGGRPFENFRVTIKNSGGVDGAKTNLGAVGQGPIGKSKHKTRKGGRNKTSARAQQASAVSVSSDEGTPSLSGLDDDDETESDRSDDGGDDSSNDSPESRPPTPPPPTKLSKVGKKGGKFKSEDTPPPPSPPPKEKSPPEPKSRQPVRPKEKKKLPVKERLGKRPPSPPEPSPTKRQRRPPSPPPQQDTKPEGKLTKNQRKRRNKERNRKLRAEQREKEDANSKPREREDANGKRVKSRRSQTKTPGPLPPRRPRPRSPPRQRSRRSLTVTPEPLPPRKRTPQPSRSRSRSRGRKVIEGLDKRSKLRMDMPSNTGDRDKQGDSRRTRSDSRKDSRRQRRDSRRSRSSRSRSRRGSGSPESPGKKKKQRTGKGALARRKERKRRGKAGLIAKEDLLRENEKMLKRLQEKSGTKSRNKATSESEKNQSLAKLAGMPESSMDGITKFSSKREQLLKKSSRKNRRIDGSETEDEDESDYDSEGSDRSGYSRSRSRSRNRSSNRSRSRGRSGSRGERKTGRRSRSRSRSTSRRSRNKSGSSRVEASPRRKSRTEKKWAHDKFQSASPVSEHGRQNAHRDGFGEHWQKIRSERSKERERNRSSSGSRSRSRSRSRSGRGRHSSRSSYTSDSRSRSRSSSFRRSSSSSSSGSVHRERRALRKEKTKKRNDPVTQAATLASKAISGEKQSQATKEQDPPVAGDGAAETGKAANDKVDMGTSGKLLEDTNLVNGVLVKYGEPSEARKPKTKWRLYVFKGNEELPILYIHRQSAYLLGRDRKVADIPLDHPSCSKQHAALQYRLVDYVRKDGSNGRRVTPYVIDLGSANGTFVNSQKIEPQKYVQLLEKDVLKFGFSSREYVMLHDQSKEQEEEDPGVE